MRTSRKSPGFGAPLALAGAAVLGIAAAPAGASIIPFLDSESAGSTAGTYDYVYQASLSADQAVGSGASLTINGVPSGASLLAGSETGFLTGWTATDTGASITFSDTSGPLTDGPLVADFTIVSSIGPGNTMGSYTAAAFKNTPGAPDNGTPTYNGGEVAVPAPSGVPEPASLALVGLGLSALGFARRRRASGNGVV